jgi:hypothetical protein
VRVVSDALNHHLKPLPVVTPVTPAISLPLALARKTSKVAHSRTRDDKNSSPPHRARFDPSQLASDQNSLIYPGRKRDPESQAPEQCSSAGGSVPLMRSILDAYGSRRMVSEIRGGLLGRHVTGRMVDVWERDVPLGPQRARCSSPSLLPRAWRKNGDREIVSWCRVSCHAWISVPACSSIRCLTAPPVH